MEGKIKVNESDRQKKRKQALTNTPVGLIMKKTLMEKYMKNLRAFRIATLFIVTVAIICLALGIPGLVSSDSTMPLSTAIALTAVGGFFGFMSFFFVVFFFLVPGVTKYAAAMQKEFFHSGTINNPIKAAADAYKNAYVGNDSTVQEDRPMMYCRNCGEKIEVDSKFCKHCGKQQ